MTPLTPRQAQALEAIRAFLAERGRTPSLRELGACLGLSRTRALQLVTGLRVAGALRWDRQIALATDAPNPPPVPEGERGGTRLVIGYGVT